MEEKEKKGGGRKGRRERRKKRREYHRKYKSVIDLYNKELIKVFLLSDYLLRVSFEALVSRYEIHCDKIRQ